MSQSLYVIQQEAGDDKKFHWKLFLADPGSTKKGVWHDVVWSEDINVGMEHRGPKPFDEAKSKKFIAMFKLGDISVANAAKVNTVAANTPTPKYKIEDKDKNCQTWIEDVVKTLVRDGVIDASALTELGKVPKVEK